MAARKSNKPERRARSASSRPLKQRAHELVAEARRTPGLSQQDALRIARKVLKSGSRAAINDLFWWYQEGRANARWTGEEPLAEMLGALRIHAIQALKGPAGHEHRNHEAALWVLADAARPSDVPLLLERLKVHRNGRLEGDLLGVLEVALQGHTHCEPTVIEALERVVVEALELWQAFPALEALTAYEVPEAVAALARLAELPNRWLRAHALADLLRRGVDVHRAAQELLAALEAVDDPEAEQQGASWARTRLGDELEYSSEQDRLPLASEAQLERFDAASDDECAAVLAEIRAGARVSDSLLLPRLRDASPIRQQALLRVLGQQPSRTHAFFHAIWPLMSDPDESTASLAVAACAATKSLQARSRLKTRFRKALAAEDHVAVRVLLRGLADQYFATSLATEALESSCDAAREAAVDTFEHELDRNGLAAAELGVLRDAAAREPGGALRERIYGLVRAAAARDGFAGPSDPKG